MKKKNNDEKVVLGLVILLLILVLIIFIGCIVQVSAGDIAKASEEETSALCLPNGNWSYTATTAGYSSDVTGSGAKITYLDRELVEMQMFSLYTSGNKTINSNEFVNWKNVTIYARVNSTISGHESFLLKKDGNTFISNNLNGSTSRALYTGHLEDGSYEFTYKFTYSPTSSTVCKYTFTFSFMVDNTDPSGSIYSNGGEVQNGSYVNRDFTFYTSDTNLKGIYVKQPGESSYSFRENLTSLTIYANGNSGRYYFYAEDLVGNTSSVMNVYLDASAPKVYMQVGTNTYTNENIGFVNKDVKLYAEDVEGNNWILYYRRGNSGSYTSSTTQVTITEEGKYTVYAMDDAGNMGNGYTFTLDKTEPTITMKYDSHNIYKDGDIVRTQVKVDVNDNISGIQNAYYERVNGSDTSDFTFSTNTSFDMEGEYTITVIDKAGNVKVVRICVDKTAPTGLYKAGSKSYYNYGCTNMSFRISPQDNFSTGHCTIEIKKDNEETFTDITENPVVSEEGFYLIKMTDQAGNYNVEYFTLDVTKPEVHLYINAQEVENGIYTNSYVIIYVSDNLSSYTTYYKKDNGEYVEYNYNDLNQDGTYYFYAKDSAGNISDVKNVKIDKGSPSITLTYKGNTYSSGTVYVNSAFSVQGTDSISGFKEVQYRYNYGDWIAFENVDDILNQEGSYTFRGIDNAGNESNTIYVTVDTAGPILYAYNPKDYSLVERYTNADSLVIYVQDGNNGNVSIELSRDNGEFYSFSNGSEIASEGKYEFRCTDNAGNSSEYILYIDRTCMIPTFSNLENVETYGDVTISWDDVEDDVPLRYVEVNGYNISNGTTIYTVQGGRYLVRYEDEVGNTGSLEFTSKKENVLTKSINKVRYEATGEDDITYSFETYNNALNYMGEFEMQYVSFETWIGPNWDEGIQMDYIDSENARAGTYYVYKSEGDENVYVAYFTEERIISVMKKYAGKHIKKLYYFEGEIAQPYEGENLYSFSLTGTIIAGEIRLNTGYVYIDGREFEGDTFNERGEHNCVIQDGYGNEVKYTFIIQDRAPEISYSSTDELYVCTRDEYNLKGEVKISLTDYIDADSMFYVTNNGEQRLYSVQDTAFLRESGLYEIVSINRYGRSEPVKFYISNTSQNIVFRNNTERKRLDINLVRSPDLHGDITNVLIYKSIDGENYSLLTEDDYGKAITNKNISYSFCTSGRYKVVLEDIFRSGISSVIEEYTFKKEKPVGTLKNVVNEGYTNKDVYFVCTDECTISISKDGEVSSYISNTRKYEDGHFIITLRDLDNNVVTYEFYIDKTKPLITLDGVQDKEITKNTVYITWNEGEGILTKDNIEIPYVQGDPLYEDGVYSLKVTDIAGNESEVKFEIDKEVRYVSNVFNGAVTNSDVKFVGNEPLNASLKFNGEKTDYNLGETITKEGYYEIVLIDERGNEKDISFRILKNIQTSFVYQSTGSAFVENVTQYGEVVEYKEPLYLTKDGNYQITIRSGNTTSIFNVTIDTKAPQVTLEGVTNGGKTKGKVVISNVSEEYTLVSQKDGVEFTYNLGDTLSEEGVYNFVFTDMVGNVGIVTFEIVHSLNRAAIALIVLGCLMVLGGIGVVIYIRREKIFKKKKKESEIKEEIKEEIIDLDEEEKKG